MWEVKVKKTLVLTSIMVTCLFLSLFLAYSVATNEPVYIIGVRPVPSVTLPKWLMPLEDVIALLPKTTNIILSNSSEIPVTLNWISVADPEFPEFDYKPYSSGRYLATATFELPEGVLPNASVPLRVTTTVIQPTALLPGLYPWVTPLTIDFPWLNQPGTYVTATMTLDGFTRVYHYYIPSSYDGSKPLPLVFSLHGGGSCGIAALITVQRIAEKEGFIAVAPDAINWRWDRAIDVRFISAIIHEMSKHYNIDARRIYAVGISMGGMMATYLAYDLPDKIAAIGIVSGSRQMAEYADAGVPLPRPMTVVITAGVPERIYGQPINEHLRARKAVNFLVQQLHCNPVPDIAYWPPNADDPYTNVTRYVYSGGIYGTEVVYYEIGNGAHGWPGGIQYAIPSSIGWITRHIDGVEEMWSILKKHALPEQVSIDIKPGSCTNSVNLKSEGVIPVAILTTCSFDATKVDHETVRFGREGWEAKPVHYALEDVDNDGDIDMILHFRTQDTGIQPGDTIAKLTGRSFYGTDTIRIVPP